MWSACGLFRNKPNITILLLLLLLLLSLQRSYNCTTTDTAKLHCLLLLLNKSTPATLTTVLLLLNPYYWLATAISTLMAGGMLEKHSKSMGVTVRNMRFASFERFPNISVRRIILPVIKKAIKRFGLLNITI